MNIKLWVIGILLAGYCLSLAGCCSPRGCFARTGERVTNLGESVKNIALDGDGVN